MHLLLLPEDKLQIQRGVVKEERSVSVDNQPYGKSEDILYDTAYDVFPYKHRVLGSMQDLDAATKPVFQAFYEQYYAPNNATLIIVGDFKSDEALAKAENYFGAVPRKPTPPRPDFAEPPQTAERRKTVQSEFAQTPRIDVAYKIPPGNSPDWYPIAVLCRILGVTLRSQ
jgi:zinc protease